MAHNLCVVQIRRFNDAIHEIQVLWIIMIEVISLILLYTIICNLPTITVFKFNSFSKLIDSKTLYFPGHLTQNTKASSSLLDQSTEHLTQCACLQPSLCFILFYFCFLYMHILWFCLKLSDDMINFCKNSYVFLFFEVHFSRIIWLWLNKFCDIVAYLTVLFCYKIY